MSTEVYTYYICSVAYYTAKMRMLLYSCFSQSINTFFSNYVQELASVLIILAFSPKNTAKMRSNFIAPLITPGHTQTQPGQDFTKKKLEKGGKSKYFYEFQNMRDS